MQLTLNRMPKTGWWRGSMTCPGKPDNSLSYAIIPPGKQRKGFGSPTHWVGLVQGVQLTGCEDSLAAIDSVKERLKQVA